MEKHYIDERMRQMEWEGVTFKPRVNVGDDITVEQLRKDFDAVVLSGGSTQPRDLAIPGRELKGVHFAMEFLVQQNKLCEGDEPSELGAERILATGKTVVILGGGDTGSDCLGTSNRQGAKLVHQFELMPQPPDHRTGDMPWPYWPMILRTSSSHEEGVSREWGLQTVRFSGDAAGNVTKLHAVRVELVPDGSGGKKLTTIAGSEHEIEADLVLLAMGFVGPEKGPLLNALGVQLTHRGNVQVNASYETSVPGVFACGDMQRGQSLVVWAIWEGREAARGVDAFLMGQSDLAVSPLLNPLVLG
jgi:glutamate synthase (NADPH/NADH) small chain